MNPDSPDQIRTLMEVAETLAREAGALVRDGRRRLVTVAATKSSAQDVVTAMDLASEALLRRRLAELRPDDGDPRRGGGASGPARPGITWVVDPIDGTVNYLYGLAGVRGVGRGRVGSTRRRAPDPATWTVLAGCVVRPRGRPDVHWRAAGSARRSTGRRCG